MLIGHYDYEIWAQGGIASYVRRISAAQRAEGHQLYYFSKLPCTGVDAQEQPIFVQNDAELFLKAEALKLDILHLHGPVSIAPPEHLPVIRTLHGHTPYCPSGSKYLKRWNQPCDRPYSLQGCLWGHLIDYCGSLHPQRMTHDFRRIWGEMAVLPQMPVVVVSQFLKDQLVRTGYPEAAIHVAYLFAPEAVNEPPPPRSGVPHFVFLGRLVPLKGLKWLLRAVQQVKEPIHLDIAGEGYEEPELRRLVQQLQLNDKVTFHGWLDQSQVKALIGAARALVFPSIWHEPGGTVAFEAMSHSRAVIMSRVGGMPEVVLPGVNGLLVEPNNIHKLAYSIEQLATDWQLAKQLGEAGQRIVTEQFTFQHHFQQLMRLYEQTISHKLNKPCLSRIPDAATSSRKDK